MVDVAEARRLQFPSLDEMCYLNTASIGLIPLSAQFAAEQFQRQLGLYGTTWFDEATEVGALDGARNAAASLLNASPDHVAITTSVTEAMSQIAWHLKPARGTNVVSIDLEFPSVTYPWMRVARETGAGVRLVRAADDPASLSFAAVADAVDEHTSIISVSHVQYATGFRFDLTELADLAEGYGARLIVDATQSLGAVPVDVSDGRIDALVCAGYKWLCGPFGAAVCYLGPRLIEELQPSFVGWKSAVAPYSMDAAELNLAASPVAQLEYSTMAYGAGITLAAAIEQVADRGIDAILEHNLDLSAQLRDGLEQLGAHILSPRGDAQRTGIVTAQFPGRDGEEVASWLTRSGVIVSPRFGSTRLAVHFFNTADDVALALRTLEAVLDHGGPVDLGRHSSTATADDSQGE